MIHHDDDDYRAPLHLRRAPIYQPDDPFPPEPEPQPERMTFWLACCFWGLAALFIGAVIGYALP